MNSKQILLVEDNPDDVALTKRALKRNNIANELIVLGDGVEAVEYLLDEGKSLPCVVLLDLKLPRLNGLEVLQRLRESERAGLVPVVILTCSAQEKDLVESYRLGANSYVRKPVDFNEFAVAVRDLGLYWLVVNEPPPASRR